jgi:ABC-type molybdate transport system permease subunit
MILVAYRLLCLATAVLVAWNLLRSPRPGEKVVYAFVLVPLVLRALLVK